MAPSRPGDPSRVVATMAILALIVAGCGGTGSNAVASSTPTFAATPTDIASLEPTSTPEPTEQPPASAAANTFTSTVYPYALTLPPRTALLAWRPAKQAWDGADRVDMVSPVLDTTSVAEGGLFIFGTPAAEGLEGLYRQIVDNETRFHGCPEPTDRRDVTIGGVPAIGFTQSCDNDANDFARVVLAQNGYGIAAFVASAPGKAPVALDRLVELLEGLEWKTP